MASSVMLRRVALVRTDVSEEHSASVIRVTRIGELGTTVAATRNRRTLRSSCHLYEGGGGSSETSLLTRATRRNIPEDAIHQLSVPLHKVGSWVSSVRCQ
jgi:hypothetical protein